jgi:phospholipase/carboxylesterase
MLWNIMNTEELQQLETVEVLTGQPVSTSVIWLHGLGADGHDFVNFIPELKLPAQKGIRFIFPHAPKRPITINQGMRMRAWYNVTSLSRLEDDLIGIQQSIQQVSQLILQQEELGIY